MEFMKKYNFVQYPILTNLQSLLFYMASNISISFCKTYFVCEAYEVGFDFVFPP